VWDGDFTHKFEVSPTPTAPLTAIPAAWHGEAFQNRILLYCAQFPAPPWSYQFIMTDILDYSGYDDILAKFQVNAGESDYITRIWPYFQQSVVVFKRRSMHLAEDFTIDPTLMTQRILSSRRGLCATKCVVESGRDLLFLDEPGGIYKLNEVIQNQISTEPYPVSDFIQPVIDQINWPYAEAWACAKALAEYAYFAFPIRPVTNGSNALAVYNTTTSQWESVDMWLDPTFVINALHVTDYKDGRAVFALDYVNKKIYALNQQKGVDEVNDRFWPIADAMETRGYTCGDPTVSSVTPVH